MTRGFFGRVMTSEAVCSFEHPVFSRLRDIAFRCGGGDGVACLVVPLGDREAVIPLDGFQREFGIAPDSRDGLMLQRVREALQFVSVLRRGDALPKEILTGEASWEPNPLHQRIAAARLQLQLVIWIGKAREDQVRFADPAALLGAAENPSLKSQVQEAIGQAAVVLDLPSGEAVLNLLEELAGELGYIEALRERLLQRISALNRRLLRFAPSSRVDANRAEMLVQVQRLAAIGEERIRARFDEIDAQTGEIMPTLRNFGRQRNFIRQHRDWLYRTQLAWEAILSGWDALPQGSNEATWTMLARTYHFLAPRFMPVTEWLTHGRNVAPKPTVAAMAW